MGLGMRLQHEGGRANRMDRGLANGTARSVGKVTTRAYIGTGQRHRAWIG